MEKEELKTLCTALKRFNHKQLSQIKIGNENGLKLEEIAVYANPYFNHHQMEQIRLAIEKGLFDHIHLFAHIKYESRQMYQIWIGLYNGLSEDKVDKYCDPNMDWTEMRRCRRQLESENGINYH